MTPTATSWGSSRRREAHARVGSSTGLRHTVPRRRASEPRGCASCGWHDWTSDAAGLWGMRTFTLTCGHRTIHAWSLTSRGTHLPSTRNAPAPIWNASSTVLPLTSTSRRLRDLQRQPLGARVATGETRRTHQSSRAGPGDTALPRSARPALNHPELSLVACAFATQQICADHASDGRPLANSPLLAVTPSRSEGPVERLPVASA